MFIMISIYFISIIAFLIHFFSIEKRQRTWQKAIELLLLYQIVFSLGVTSFLAFIGLTFMPQLVADHMGWPTCPFQQELANVNLAFGILGIMSIWKRGEFWTATVLGFSIWIIADGIHHIVDSVTMNNFSEGNVGTILYTDILVPVILLVLLYIHEKLKK